MGPLDLGVLPIDEVFDSPGSCFDASICSPAMRHMMSWPSKPTTPSTPYPNAPELLSPERVRQWQRVTSNQDRAQGRES
jgi:hypothetical protein